MLRRTHLWWKATRSWTQSAIAASSPSSAHFPNAIRVDPANERKGKVSAKEINAWMSGKNVFVTSSEKSTLEQKTTHFLNAYCSLVHFWRPAGWKLLLYPCYWGCSLAVTQALIWEGADPAALFAPFIPMHQAFALFVGAYMLRSCGCIVNDWLDGRRNRVNVERADSPANEDSVALMMMLMKKKMALPVLLSHGFLGLVTLFSFSPTSVATSIVAVPIALSYLIIKRYAWPAQIALASYTNWGVFVGYAAILNRVDWGVCLPVYLAGIAWTIITSTLHAHRGRDLYSCNTNSNNIHNPYNESRLETEQINSSARWFGQHKDYLQLLIIPVFSGFAISGFLASQNAIFFAGLALCMYQLNTVIDNVNFSDRWSCDDGFKISVRIGLFVLLAMFAGNLLWAVSSTHEPEHDAHTDTATANSALRLFLEINQHTPLQVQNAEALTVLDRFIHPVFVQTEMSKLRGETDLPPIPAWMRREYIGDNVTSLLRLVGCSEEVITKWVTFWFGSLDHYNLMPGMFRE